MLRIPTFSLGLFVIGMIAGGILGGEGLAFALGGTGSVIGYVIWIGARLKAIQAGRAFHLGSAAGTVLCTVFALGVGIVGMFGTDAVSNAEFWLITLSVSALAIGLQGRAARQAGSWRLMPTMGEVGHEVLPTVFTEDLGSAAIRATWEVGAEAVKMARHGASHPAPADKKQSAAAER